ncbi:ketol-acid reductoisomerase (NADP(+)) [Iodidimonas nitroreducens]|uniref:Ketol-acid reductoisomerase (NADP(+)) n=1 Tax=Iodidimonas nitroreducens TaxID=1236968 RepID=A0A5A7NC61_9PROT|nr:ketol-acid reductoisomerase [Iodidimonas nitroreducens]GAK32551.1 ketol-acid reductoisomerase [alpha proteobacterium Q-1]GER04556.1 ketol-acid reductoisomerase (NADP(+)) [Iodidimonas nitroreducens]
MKLYNNSDVDQAALKGKTIAIIGYGSQGRAHACNLKDSGHKVVVGVREGGKGWQAARQDGHDVAEPAAAAKAGDLIAILVPDMAQEALYRETIAPALEPGNTLLFAHGFSVHYGRITPPEGIDVVMIAPKAPGDLVRREYEIGRGVPCLLAVHQDASGSAKARALAYAHGLGGTHAGVLETTFPEETITDLFGEQAVLCGGMSELVLKGFETLTEAGYQPEVAYFECLHELKLIVDLMQEGGLAKMLSFISETAKYGDFVSGPRVVDETTKARMKAVLTDIENGTFARDWILENQAGLPRYKASLQKDLDHPIEKTGSALRARMAWLNPKHNA